MRFVLGLAAATLLAAPAGAQREKKYLLSMSSLPIASGQYISSFEIRTWDVRILAVCRIPEGWDLGGGTDGSLAGRIHGEGGVGLAYIADAKAPLLKDMVLVAFGTVRAHRTANLPATFSATVNVGRYGPDERTKRVSLAPASLTWRRAERCP